MIVDDVGNEGDADASDAKRRENQEEEVDYESEEGEDAEGEDLVEEKEEPAEENSEEVPDEVPGDLATEEPGGAGARKRSKQKSTHTQDSMRVNTVLETSSSIEGYSYDSQQGLWCEVCTPSLCPSV
jgi:DNA-directed RNA polymerase I subunit RPA1